MNLPLGTGLTLLCTPGGVLVRVLKMSNHEANTIFELQIISLLMLFVHLSCLRIDVLCVFMLPTYKFDVISQKSESALVSPPYGFLQYCCDILLRSYIGHCLKTIYDQPKASNWMRT